MAKEQMWFEMVGEEGDIVLSSRVRLARNLKDLPFPHRMTEQQRKELIERGEKALCKNQDTVLPLQSIRSLDVNPAMLTELAEHHIVSPDFLEGEEKELIVSTDQSIAVMVGEEDHFRIQAFRPGLDLRGAYNSARVVGTALEKKENIAFDQSLGYLTQCPTNLGTGMRASVMMHLPALEAQGALRAIAVEIGKLGLTIRGTYGEGSSAVGSLYQVSNQVTLGVTEEGAIANLQTVVLQIVHLERKSREKLNRAEVEDRAYRALGILKYMRRVSSGEMQDLISSLRLGIGMHLMENVPMEVCSKLQAIASPGAIISHHGGNMTPEERDLERARLAREITKG